MPILARRFDCDVYPSRCTRLPGNRYRLEIEEKLELARNDDGDIDIHASTQQLNDVVERWVREDPGQWMWFHKRWTMSNRQRSRRNRRNPAPVVQRKATAFATVEIAADRSSTAVVIHHRVAGFGKKQPAFDEHSGTARPWRGMRPAAAISRPRAPAASRTKNSSAGTAPPNANEIAASFAACFRATAKPHFAGQVVVVDMWPLEQPHLADESEPGRGFGRRHRTQRVHPLRQNSFAAHAATRKTTARAAGSRHRSPAAARRRTRPDLKPPAAANSR